MIFHLIGKINCGKIMAIKKVSQITDRKNPMSLFFHSRILAFPKEVVNNLTLVNRKIAWQNANTKPAHPVVLDWRSAAKTPL